jgi:hypothetical protein
MATSNGLKINVSCKVAELPRHSGEVTYEEYPEVVEAIINQVSGTPTA